MEGRTVILGIGNRLKGDDGAGSRVVELIADAGWIKEKGVVVLDAGPVPENFIGKVKKEMPARVLLVDACVFGGVPGEFRIFDYKEIDSLALTGFSTHTVPLSALATLLIEETGAEVWLLGIQPASGSLGEGLSPAVGEALPGVADFIRRWVG